MKKKQHQARHPQERAVVEKEPRPGKGPGTKFAKPDQTPRVKRHDSMAGSSQRDSLTNPAGLTWTGNFN